MHMTINRLNKQRISFTTRIFPETKKQIEALCAEYGKRQEGIHIPQGYIIERAVAALAKVDLGETAEG
jgi:hypothetical protein